MQFQPLVNPMLQAQWMLHNPFSFFIAIINTLTVNNYFTESMIGVLGWFNYTYQPIVYSIYFLIFGYAIRELLSYKEKILPYYASLLLSFICIATFILPFLAMYLFWTPVGYSMVLGVQGRYFLLIFPFVLLLIHQLYVSIGKRKMEVFLMWVIIFFISSQSLMTVYLRYYKEPSKNNDVGNLIKYDPTKIKYMPVNKQISFGFDLKEDKKKVTGFKFSFTTHNQKIVMPYRYKLMDKSCAKTYKEGELDMEKLQSDSIYQEDFSPYLAAEQNICLILEPTLFSAGDHYISIIADEQSPRIELLNTLR